MPDTGTAHVAPGLHHPGIADIQGLANAALPLVSLAAAQGQHRGGVGVAGGGAAVVGREADDRVLGEPEAIQSIDHQADGLVHRLDHARVDRAVLHQSLRPAAVEAEPSTATTESRNLWVAPHRTRAVPMIDQHVRHVR